MNNQSEPKPMDFEDESAESGGLVYFVSDGTAVKIGHTTGKVTDRVKQLQTGNPRLITVVRTIPGDQSLERSYHERFAERLVRQNSEWFAIQPWEIWGLDQPGFVKVGQVENGQSNASSTKFRDVQKWLDETVVFHSWGPSLFGTIRFKDPLEFLMDLWGEWDSWRKQSRCKTLSRTDFDLYVEQAFKESGCSGATSVSGRADLLKMVENALWLSVWHEYDYVAFIPHLESNSDDVMKHADCGAVLSPHSFFDADINFMRESFGDRVELSSGGAEAKRWDIEIELLYDDMLGSVGFGSVRTIYVGKDKDSDRHKQMEFFGELAVLRVVFRIHQDHDIYPDVWSACSSGNAEDGFDVAFERLAEEGVSRDDADVWVNHYQPMIVGFANAWKCPGFDFSKVSEAIPELSAMTLPPPNHGDWWTGEFFTFDSIEKQIKLGKRNRKK
jgi:hypothetical protein